MNTQETPSHDAIALPVWVNDVGLFGQDEDARSRARHPWETSRSLALLLTLLPMLRSCPARHTRPPRQEWNLPNGCAFAVRYRSR